MIPFPKSRLLTALALVITSGILWHPLAAQTRLSPKFGFVYPDFSTDLAPLSLRAQGTGGSTIGLDLRIERRRLFLHPGIHFQSVRTDLDNPLSASPLPGEQTKIRSIKLPLQVGGYVTGDASFIRLHLKGGLVPEWTTGVKPTDRLNLDRDRVEDVQWGGCLGAGADFLLLTVDFRYDFGLSPIFTDSGDRKNMATFSIGLIL